MSESESLPSPGIVAEPGVRTGVKTGVDAGARAGAPGTNRRAPAIDPHEPATPAAIDPGVVAAGGEVGNSPAAAIGEKESRLAVAGGEIEGHRATVSGAAILFVAFVIGVCGLLYELLASTLASYVLGDSVTQFSTIIGVYLFSMGVGSWLSRFFDRQLVARFIEVEIAVCLIGGCSSAILFLSFGRVEFFRVLLYAIVGLIGTLVGFEIPILIRILKDRYDLKELLARVLTVDCLGALVASIAFPIIIVPKLGLVRGAFVAGLINGIVALFSTYVLAAAISRRGQLWFLRVQASLCILVMVAGVFFSDSLTKFAEDAYYSDPVIYSRTSTYQRMVVTRGPSAFHLYLNGHLQFSSSDEHRYHEALVHPAMAVGHGLAGGRTPSRVLVLGGGDGLAVREVLRYPEVEEVILVDLDPAMTEVARDHPLFRAQNRDALHDARVKVVHADAMVWLRELAEIEGPKAHFDAIIADFPDPSSYSLGKLYTTRFYRLVQTAMAPDGVLVAQATSPLIARRAFWCIIETMAAVGLFVRPFQAAVPSFGVWGYALAARRPFEVPRDHPPLAPETALAFLNPETMQGMFAFPADMSRVVTDVNRLDNQVLVRYYESEWSAWQ